MEAQKFTVSMEIHLKIEGMVCSACAESIERAVSRLNGVTEVSVDLATELASVIYDERAISEAELNQTISDAGFEVRAG